MRLRAAIQGNLKELMEKELQAAGRGVVNALREAGTTLKEKLRAQVQEAGLGRRLGNAWRSEVYPNQVLDAASLVYSKAVKLHEVFNEGVAIQAANGKKYLAIPVRSRNKRVEGLAGTKVKVRNRAELHSGLKFIPGRNGKNPVLVREIGRKYGPIYNRRRFGPLPLTALTGRKRRKSGRGPYPRKFRVEFILVPLVYLRKRFDIEAPARAVQSRLDELIMKHYQE